MVRSTERASEESPGETAGGKSHEASAGPGSPASIAQ
jgi:hypothetical protein